MSNFMDCQDATKFIRELRLNNYLDNYQINNKLLEIEEMVKVIMRKRIMIYVRIAVIRTAHLLMKLKRMLMKKE